MSLLLWIVPWWICCCLVTKSNSSNSFVTPWTAAHQASLSMRFPRQENRSGVPFPSPEDITFLLKRSYVNAVNFIYNLFNLFLFSRCRVQLPAAQWTAAHLAAVLHYYLPKFAQTHVHWVDDTLQPSHPLSPSSPPSPNLSQHQDLFQWVSSSDQVAKVLELQLQHQSLQCVFRVDFL